MLRSSWRALALVAPLLLWAGCSPASPSPAQDASVERSRDGVHDSTALPDTSADARETLRVGELSELVADGAGQIVGSTPINGGERFMLLLTSLDETPRRTHAYKVTESGTQAMVMEEHPPAGRANPHRCRFTEELRRIHRSGAQILRLPRPWQAAKLPPQLGEERPFQVGSHTITARVVRVDSVAAFWLDQTTTPRAQVHAAMLDEVAQAFANVVVPRERAYFGLESDIDGDGTISVLISPLVEEEAIAYFSPCDLVDPNLVAECFVSNQMELLYLSPLTQTWGKYPTEMVAGILAHELSHAIYFYRKFVRNSQPAVPENPYITEGLAALAADLTGYGSEAASVTEVALDEVDGLSVPNLTSDAILEYAEGHDSMMRGGGYLLMRYLFDRAGGDAMDAAGKPQDRGGIGWMRAFYDSADTHGANITKTTGLSLGQLSLDFWTAVALSNRGPDQGPLNPDPRYNFLPITVDPITNQQRGCSLFTGTWPKLRGPKTQRASSADQSIFAGGAEFLILSAGWEQAALTLRVATAPAANARVRLIRIE